MKDISWQNFMMMNSVIPTSGSEGSKSDGGGNSGMLGNSSMSLFDIGMRLQEGKGV